MLNNTLSVGKIEEGFVLDHIQAGRSMDIYKYLHRIYNMRILAGILLPGLDKFVARLPQTSPELVVHMEVKNLLKRNLNATKTIVQKLKNLKRPEATQALLELKKSNKELDELVLKHNISELKTAF